MFFITKCVPDEISQEIIFEWIICDGFPQRYYIVNEITSHVDERDIT